MAYDDYSNHATLASARLYWLTSIIIFFYFVVKIFMFMFFREISIDNPPADNEFILFEMNEFWLIFCFCYI